MAPKLHGNPNVSDDAYLYEEDDILEEDYVEWDNDIVEMEYEYQWTITTLQLTLDSERMNLLLGMLKCMLNIPQREKLDLCSQLIAQPIFVDAVSKMYICKRICMLNTVLSGQVTPSRVARLESVPKCNI